MIVDLLAVIAICAVILVLRSGRSGRSAPKPKYARTPLGQAREHERLSRETRELEQINPVTETERLLEYLRTHPQR
jgi:hypothetical protein